MTGDRVPEQERTLQVDAQDPVELLLFEIEKVRRVACLTIMRGLRGADWLPEGTHVAFRGPKDVAPYREIVGARFRFDAEVTSFEFA